MAEVEQHPNILGGAREGNGIGIIIPPPARKPIIDKTAAFVAKTGRHIEEEILNRPQGANAANFTFLLEDDPFHAYYLSKIAEFQATGVQQPLSAPQPTVPVATPLEAPTPASTVSAAPVLRASSLVEALRASSKKKGQEPPPFEFTLETPTEASAYAVGLMKLTAQFAATEGKKFEADIFHKEKQNSEEYGFLHATHPHHSYYAELVRCYKKLMDGNIGWVLDLAKSEKALLDRAVHRFEFRRDEALKQVETDEKRSLERMAFLEIDWHDFVVVETIRFDEDEEARNFVPGLGIDALVSEAADAARKAIAVDDSDEIGEVRKDYTVQPVRATMNVPMVTLANGQQVPVTEMNDTVRANSLDPKWREYQERFEARQRETNLVEGGSMPVHLARMAGARPDVFGGEREDAERRQEERKRKKDSEVVRWDGNLLNADSFRAMAASMSTAPSTSHSSIPSLLSSAPPPSIAPPLPPNSQFRAPIPSAPSNSFPLPPPQAASFPQSVPESKRQKLTPGGAETFVIIVPSGGPPGIDSSELSLNATGSATVNDFKELISVALSNVAVSKFQLKTADGRFLKNTDPMSSLPPGSTIELKWKSR